MNPEDAARQAIERIAAPHPNGRPAAPPFEMVMAGFNVEVGEGTVGKSQEQVKLLILTHPTGGLRVVVPLPKANARVVGNALCDRPNIALPG